MSRSNSSQHNVTAITSNQISIHLGNYIISVPKNYVPEPEDQTSPVKRPAKRPNSRSGQKPEAPTGSAQMSRDRSRSPAIPLPTTEMQKGSKSAISFELNWIKFVKDAEDEYNRRMCKNEKTQPLSVFEVNVDIFELYLMNVSGRALTKIQNLNLDLKSALCADMKLFDNQSGTLPPEHIMEADQNAELEKRRRKRQFRRERNRRQTAHFNTHIQDIQAALIEEGIISNIEETQQNIQQTHILSVVDAQDPNPLSIVQESPNQIVQQETPVIETQVTIESPPPFHEETQELKLQLQEVIVNQPEQNSSINVQRELEQQQTPASHQSQQMEEEIKKHDLIDSPPPVPKKKKVMIDSLNDRSDDEEGSPGDREDSSPIQETEEDEFARDDLTITAENAKPVLQVFNSNGLTVEEVGQMNINSLQVVTQSSDVMSPDLRTPEQNISLQQDDIQNKIAIIDHEANNLEISIDDQDGEKDLQTAHQVPDIEQPLTPQQPQKIKIGDMTIEDPYMSINDQRDDRNASLKSAIIDTNQSLPVEGESAGGEHYTIQDVTDPMLNNSNPFREKSVISQINSPQKSNLQKYSVQTQDELTKRQESYENQDYLIQQNTSKQLSYRDEKLNEENLNMPRSVTDPTQANLSQHQKSNRSLLGQQQLSANVASAHTHKQSNVIQNIDSQQSIQPLEYTHSNRGLIQNIEHERNEEVIANGNLADHSMSAITTGRQVKGNLSAMNTLRVPLEEELVEQPEREVVLRFEVAVGTTPLNLTFDEGSALFENQTNKNEAGVTPLDRTVEQMRDNLPDLIKSDATNSQEKLVTNGKDVALSPHPVPSQNSRQSKSVPHQHQEAENSNSPARSLNASQEKHAKSQTPSRLEVTLTAEPDKPIMVEVRGGEKQFLISALTKHIFDILSQPNRLQIMQDQNGNVQFVDNSDSNAPGQHLEPVVDNTGHGAFKLGNQNINLRLKGIQKDSNLGLPMLQNLGGKNAQSSTQQPQLNDSLPDLRQSQQKVNQSYQDISQSMENQRQQSYHHTEGARRDDSQSLQGFTAVAGDQSGYIKQNDDQNRKNISVAQSRYSLEEQQQERKVSPPQTIQQVAKQQEINKHPKNKRNTVMASADGKIQEEQVSSSFEGEIPQSSQPNQLQKESNKVAKTPTLDEIAISKHASAEGSFRKVRLEATSPNQYQDQLRSRPETANFNKAYAVADQIDNPFINGQEEENSLINQPQLETPKRMEEEDILIADQTNSALQKSRLETPNGADAQEGIPFEQLQNSSSPADFDEYVKSPLHPTIPDQHHNGYFSTESDYLMVMPGNDGQSLEIQGSSNSNDQYLTPKLAYYDQYNLVPQAIQMHHNIPTPQQIQQQLLRHQSINDFYSSQYGYSDAEQNMEDFILAEGYPLLNFIKQDKNGRNSMTSLKTEIQSRESKRHPDLHNNTNLDRGKKVKNLYDFNASTSYSHQNTLTHANLNTPPNAYRIRKVILPNYPNATSNLNQSELEDSQKPSPLSTQHHNLRPLFNNMLQPNAPAAGVPLRKQKTLQASSKLLPVVKTRKRIFNNTMSSTIYSVNGGPAYKSIPLSHSHQARSLSPLRKKNQIFYTSNFIMTQKKVLEQLQMLNAATQASTINNNGTLISQNGMPLNAEEFAQFAYYSQSPQPRRKNSPYLSDDEYKILQNYYDIQCEPTGINRGGVPLMKVKRVNKPKNRTFNIFNFPDDPTANVALPKALTSLQIFYPQFQPSQAEFMARTHASPSKWFDRFNQSTRNLNQTINNLHQQHNRKLRSYSISNLTSQNSATADTINDSRNMKARCGSQNSLFQKRNQIKERQAALEKQRTIDNNSLSPPNSNTLNNISHDMSKISNTKKNKKIFTKDMSMGNSNHHSTTFMPPLHKIYSASLSHHHHENSQDKSRMSKKSTASSGTGIKNLPPRPHNKRGNGPKIGINVLGASIEHQGPSISVTPTSDHEGKMPSKQKNLLMPTQTANIINTNHNQYVCFGVNIITKSDK